MSSNNFTRFILSLALASVLYALFTPGSFAVQVIIWTALAVVIATAMRFVMLVGEFNLATGAFYGIGAYTAGYLNTVWDWPLWMSVPAAAVMAAIVALLLGYTTMRTFGAYFMLITFAFSEIVRLVYVEVPALGGNNGILGIMPPLWIEPYFPALVVSVCILLVLGLALIERSSLGLVFRAIKNKEAVARSVGINVLTLRVLCLVIASIAVAVAGALYAHVNTVISPGDFTFMLSVFALAYVKLGGDEHPVGPVVGAAILTVVAQFLLSFGSYDQLFFGAIIVLAMVALPTGLIGRLEQLGVIKTKTTGDTSKEQNNA